MVMAMKDQFAAVLIARSLEDRIPNRSRARLDWRARLRLTEDPSLAFLESEERKALVAATSRATATVAQQLLEVVRSASFQQLESTRRLHWLTAIAQHGLATVTLETLASLLAFDVTDQVWRHAMREVFRHPRTSGPAIAALARGRGFGGLAVVEQMELLRFLTGPRAPRARRAAIEAWWAPMRCGLVELCDAIANAPDAVQTEQLRDFLYLPSEPLYVLESKTYLGREILIFGEPQSPTSISYGEVAVVRITGDRSSTVESPDRVVASGWTLDDGASTTYGYRRLAINRDEMRRIIEWAERRLDGGPRDRAGFVRAAEHVAELMTGPGDEHSSGTMQYGRAHAAPMLPPDEECDALLAAYLAA